jgi:Mg2+ transporter MgtE
MYFSQLLESKVIDAEGRPAGKLHDIGMSPDMRFPQSRFLVVSRTRRGRRETVAVPWEWVQGVEAGEIRLNRRREEIWKSDFRGEGLLLARNLLDRQIVDLHGRKVVRVNDLRLSLSDSRLRLTGVDVSGKALLRRLGLEGAAGRLLRLAGRTPEEHTIPWNLVAPLEISRRDLQLKVTRGQLAALRPPDIADILEQLEPQHRERLLDLLGEATAAETLSEVEESKQLSVIEDLSETRASNLLEVMPPDEAADILGKLPRDKAERLLNIMGVKEAGVIRELLGFREDTAGGRMTTEFLAVRDSFTAEECIRFLRENAPDAETLYYLYVVDDEGRLKGVVSMRDLLTSSPQRRVEEFMIRDVVAVHVDDDQEKVADLISRYNFLALPVVDDDNLLRGIVTFDDLIDVMREETVEDLSQLGGFRLEEEKTASSFLARLPSVALALLGGITASLLFLLFRDRLLSLVTALFFLPMILRAAQDIGYFSQAVILEEIGGKELGAKDIVLLAAGELRVVLFLSLGLGIIGFLIAFLWEGRFRLGLAVGLTMLSSVIAGALLGTMFPIVFRKLRGELRYTQARFVSLFTWVLSLAVFLGITSALL